MELNRGDIVIVNLYPKKGDEVGKIRPAVIISGNDENSILQYTGVNNGASFGDIKVFIHQGYVHLWFK